MTEAPPTSFIVIFSESDIIIFPFKHSSITDNLVHVPKHETISQAKAWTSMNTYRRGSRILSGGPASEAQSCQRSEAESCKQSEPLATGVQGLLRGPGSFLVFNAEISILLYSRGSFPLIFDR